ncbi:MAG: hypothetical protein A3C84_04330 [Candidatus Ryanbacteria bacterium RIFCSPHIGHO2_02_FULL_48_12]|uniref:DUF5666 domain-containing protein n=1 Tax=Candidatus Ryanbacteria bacterium RIFCSPHIGHO2_01_FULL_48_27 TaxID=1802115 RepID=A0A1G2G5I4_9BACT|nr:MAG: hypothetical protein A2756_00630 [Candidatus Ryanbacteria bacterium RIFCSPHIGHO2_01_FULL_48_27]OGZ48591.1 MAG: hypothetical protein A3C84_04330 [Candidatus Ryanbacteria bacterium RIFCSPHIGHO2_02_FULL_48_12]
MDKKIIAVTLGAIIIAGGSFYAGTRYDRLSGTAPLRGTGNFADLSPEERQARFQQMGAVGMSGRRGMRTEGMAGFTNGEVIAKDDRSITVKLREGGSRILFLSGTTQIMKSASSSIANLSIGTQVMATGKANADGSINAESVQIRPSISITQ